VSTLFGGIRQLAFVVTDAQAAMRYWSGQLGVGPFFVVPRYEFIDYRYRGEPAQPPIVTLCFAQSGALQIELIEQHNDAPSAYRDFLTDGREGAQHMAAWFADPDEYEHTRARMASRGFKLIHESGAGNTIARFAYFETQIAGGMMVELAEALRPSVRAIAASVAEAANHWDGCDPIRVLS
jgi:catechol 2,3-dioxygenase-like lactoylglutathione lyase family enzyme